MSFLELPNLPDGDVNTAIIDGRAPQSIKAALDRLNISPILTEAHPDVYEAIACHPDIMLHHIGGEVMVYAPNTPERLVRALEHRGFEMVRGHTGLGSKYPMTIPYNVARVGKFALHNTRYTDPVVKELLEAKGIEFIHTNQGYSKCLTCIVDSNSIITSDQDIYKRAVQYKMEVLLIEPDDSIRLEPLSMGFFGGAAGLVGKNRLAIAGNLKTHKSCGKILDFLSLKCVDVVMLNDERLIDMGSIIPIMQNRKGSF